MTYINNDNFEQFAGHSYLNPCFDLEEYVEDIGRIKYIKRLFNKYRSSGELKDRLIINHLMILFNVFETHSLLKMLFFKFEGYHDCLKPFLIYIQRLPDQIPHYTTTRPTLFTSDIPSDETIVQNLRTLLRNE